MQQSDRWHYARLHNISVCYALAATYMSWAQLDLEVMRMTSLVTFTSAPAILGGKKNCSALSAALTYGTVARPESSSAGADCL